MPACVVAVGCIASPSHHLLCTVEMQAKCFAFSFWGNSSRFLLPPDILAELLSGKLLLLFDSPMLYLYSLRKAITSGRRETACVT